MYNSFSLVEIRMYTTQCTSTIYIAKERFDVVANSTTLVPGRILPHLCMLACAYAKTKHYKSMVCPSLAITE
jgi:hypothetical protein